MTDLTVPEGFVEFSMQMMARAIKYREDGKTPESAMDDLKHLMWSNYVDMAALACIAGVEPPTIEGVVNGASDGR